MYKYIHLSAFAEFDLSLIDLDTILSYKTQTFHKAYRSLS